MLNHTVLHSSALELSARLPGFPDSAIKMEGTHPAAGISQLISTTGIRGLLESFSDPFIILDFQGIIVSFNEKADLQEQFSNILKHARASHIHIILSTAGNECRLEIKDDGIGCEKWGNSDGIGLMNIRHRAAQLKGTCQIVSAPGRGCSLQIVIPL